MVIHPHPMIVISIQHQMDIVTSKVSTTEHISQSSHRIDFSIDYIDEQNSPQTMGTIQHQAPDTTSPSPPHPYSTNGNSASSLGNYSSDGNVPLWAQSASAAAGLCKSSSHQFR